MMVFDVNYTPCHQIGSPPMHVNTTNVILSSKVIILHSLASIII